MAPHDRGVCGAQAGIMGSTSPGGDEAQLLPPAGVRKAKCEAGDITTSQWERAMLCCYVVSRGYTGSENTSLPSC